MPQFVGRGLTTTFDGLAGIPGLGSIALLGTLAVVLTRRAGLVLVAASATVNVSVLSRLSVEWAQQTEVQRNTFNLVAGSELASQVDHDIALFPESATVHVSNLPDLVALGALTPRRPRPPEATPPSLAGWKSPCPPCRWRCPNPSPRTSPPPSASCARPPPAGRRSC